MIYSVTFLNIPLFPEKVTWLGSPLFPIIWAIIAWFIFNGFKKNREIQRSIAAAKAYNEIQSCSNYIVEIKLRPDLYEFKGYYPNKIPETTDGNSTNRYPERPARLMQNRVYLCRRKLGELLAQIGNNHAKQLLDHLSSMEKEASLLGNSIFAQTQTNESIKNATSRYLDAYPQKIAEIREKMFQILVPLIEGKGWQIWIKNRLKLDKKYSLEPNQSDDNVTLRRKKGFKCR